ncbi:GAF domain-containing protein [Paraburkholderia sp. EG285A]|uniref:GAF domain-containing protein n=1 Tax=Paraburkholderia sp. EG285A TaxID=3237009 RepID=UPI0034D2936F
MEQDKLALLPAALSRVARASHENRAPQVIWEELERSVTDIFGQTLFTVLAYNDATKRLCRLHSNRLDINPVGGIKRVTPSRWVEHVLNLGDVFVGSNRNDIKAVFSEYEVLWSIGCESVLNIPVRHAGVTIGTLNLLGPAGLYDRADTTLALVFGQLAAGVLQVAAESLGALADPASMEQV